ncbi:uncharacterized protein BCR38DRAFT_471884 [Pseudomassariella vexata]|uniref:Uncharacterized protein n=1 Tax=Pseudomassariella vexata TaxID=1141098 RepID=A0A1Y2EBR0_9PEZI|nr:uncharacterized protein BCR38DRAFT_471884 [Pseudomassariella vexata]ORY68285.1 hypothetical protein BCR38DRAFT_471884 [Pseudomassariella vexata]
MADMVSGDVSNTAESQKMASVSVILIPWDPESQEHAERMAQQRIACGWKQDQIENWKDQQREGLIGLHWIVLPPSDPNTTSRLERHIFAFPDEATPLHNTCKRVLSRSHTPDPAISTFIPIGHISLDSWSPYDSLQTSPSNGVYSLTTFYVSKALQYGGIGGAAMTACETMAARDFGAKAITLDTLANEEYRPDNPRRAAMGLEQTRPRVTPQDWYQRRGYIIYLKKEDGFFDTDPTGKIWGATLVCLKKELV